MSIGPTLVKSFYEEAHPKLPPDEHGEIPGTLTTSGAVLAMISTILGGGMVGIPFSFYSCGLYAGISIAIFAAS